MSAAAMSKMIRDKKKKMEDESGAVKLSGIPMDATDEYVNKMKEEGELLSENIPEDHDDGQDMTAKEGQDEDKKNRMDKVHKMMMRMKK